MVVWFAAVKAAERMVREQTKLRAQSPSTQTQSDR